MMTLSNITKISSGMSTLGPQGEKLLASGITTSMRLWENEPAGEAKPPTARDYETVGYVIRGRAELKVDGETVMLEPGDSWAVNRGQVHSYRILEPFTAIEATTPPAGGR